MIYTKKVTIDQLLNITTWGETLQEHLINGTVALLKQEGKIESYQYFTAKLEKGEDCINVIVDTT